MYELIKEAQPRNQVRPTSWWESWQHGYLEQKNRVRFLEFPL